MPDRKTAPPGAPKPPRQEDGHAGHQAPVTESYDSESTSHPSLMEDYQYHLTEGEPVVTPATVSWMVLGLLLGGTVGWIAGSRIGLGIAPMQGLAPLAAGGAGVTGFIFACLYGSVVALAGALVTTARDAERYPHPGRHSHGDPREREWWIARLPVWSAAALAVLMILTLARIASHGVGSGEPSDQSNRITPHQKNATRLGGLTPEETALMVYQTAYPATRAQNRPGAVYAVPDDWRLALAMTPLIGSPTNAILLLPSADDAKAAEREELLRMGFTAAALKSESDTDPARLAATLDRRRNEQSGVIQSVMLVALDQDPRWALPAAAYAARTATPVLFTARDSLPDATESALRLRNGHARIFLMGPTDVISGKVERELSPFGTVSRIESGDPVANSVRFAELRDERANFGWGHVGRGPRQFSSTNTILVNGSRWQDAIVAAHLARRGKPGPILLTDRDKLPAAVDNHLWRQRPAFAETPAEGPFSHVWVVGGEDRISYSVQAWADYSQEIGQYMTLGDSAVSGYEALAIGWLILSIASAVWVLVHSVLRMRAVMPVMKAAWTVFTLLLGPVALVMYIRNYHRRPTYMVDGMTHWERPTAGQAVSATVMMFGFDMLLMALAVFALGYWGFPILRIDGPFFWFGSSMFLMMLFMYIVALAGMLLAFHTPMTMQHEQIYPYRRALRIGFPIALATMTVESLGMMPTMWWQQMSYLPGMQMPTPDDITMWGTLLVAIFIGFLAVLPFNYWLVKTGRKVGTM